MKKILLIFGTRPEGIKMAPVVKKLMSNPSLTIKICITGQHKEMLKQVLDLFSITPDYDLHIMKQNQTLYDITADILIKIQDVFDAFSPDLVIVHGDTTTAFVAALAAYYKKIPIAHVEAGLRTNDIFSPYPEEGNRRLISVLASYFFAPTESSKQNLLSEGIDEQKICVTGNTVIDALQMIILRLQAEKKLTDEVTALIKDMGYVFSKRKILLVTGHRRENFGEGVLNICKALMILSQELPDVDIIYPVHLNPNISEPVYKLLGNVKNIFLLSPLDYLPFVYLMYNSYVILTDSGGIQEEAPSLGKPVLVMRDVTERPEAVKAGTVKLVGTDTSLIVRETLKLFQDEKYYQKIALSINPYGDGFASDRILKFLLDLNV